MVLLALSYLFIGSASPVGLLGLVVLWSVVIVFALGPISSSLRPEADGALFVFLVAAYVDSLDILLGRSQTFTLTTALLGMVYLSRRLRDVLAVLASPVAFFLAVFVAQEIVSAWAFAPDALPWVLTNRLALMETVLCTAVLARRPSGQALVPLLIVLAALMSVPMLAREFLGAERLAFESVAVDGGGRGGGYYLQPNGAGIALTYAMACAAALYLRGAIATATLLGAVAFILAGVFCTVSRGALGTSLLVLPFIMLTGLRARLGLRGILFGLVGIAGLPLLLRPIADALGRANTTLQNLGLADITRLQELVLALTGATGDLLDESSAATRSGLIDRATHLIAARPLFGYGTGGFMGEGGYRSHVQWLELMGENGAVGMVFYGCVLASVGVALVRLPRRLRLGAILIAGVWLVAHFHNHDMMEVRYMALPLAYLAGLDARDPSLDAAD